MGRRRRSRRHHSNGGMLGGLRKHVKQIAGAAVGLTGLFIAASPAIGAANAATANGTVLNQASFAQIGPTIANQYGVNTSTGQVDFGKLITSVVFPVIGAVIFIKGIKYVVRHV